MGTRAPVVLSLGMGIDSVALLVRWLLEPETRRRPDGTPFGLDDLTVVTAMTGDEYERTGWLMTTYLLPLLRQHRVRYVQVSRAGQSDTDGYVVLSDSRDTRSMTMRGPWRLSDENVRNGTIPQVASKRRWCSARAKAQPIDAFVADDIGEDYVHVIGFAAEEASRAERSMDYSSANQQMFPLIDWGWDRDRCDDYLFAVFGVRWQRSCCAYCPFQYNKAGLAQMVERWRADLDGAVLALTMEWTALALNPKAALFGKKTARSVALAHGLDEAVAAADAQIAAAPWAVYNVRRIYRPGETRMVKSRNVWRSTRIEATGTAADMADMVRRWPDLTRDWREYAELDTDERGVARAYLYRAVPPYPAVEEFVVAAPAGVIEKERKNFAAAWATVVAGLGTAPRVVQPRLFDLEQWARNALAELRTE